MKRKELIANVGKTRGHFSRKENRAAKLIAMWPALHDKFEGMIVRGRGTTESARCAYATLLMMETGIRIGNESSAEGFISVGQRIAQKDNKEKGIKKGDILWTSDTHGKLCKTYGLTTLLQDHVSKHKNRLLISFVGKKHVEQELVVRSPVLIRYCPPTYQKGKSFLNLDYYTLKKFIKRYVGNGFAPKDLRTAKVNIIFADLFSREPYSIDFHEASSKSARNKVLSNAIEETAGIIGHTKGVCRSAYLSKPLIEYISNKETESWPK